MRSLAILIMSLSFLTATYAQQQAIKITNEVSKKEKIIKENKRVILTTKDGQMIKGRLMLGDNNTVVVDGVKIRLTDIDQLKRNPFSTSILTSEILVDDMVDTSGFWLVIPAAAIIYTGIISPNFNKNFETDKGWQFEVITIPDKTINKSRCNPWPYSPAHDTSFILRHSKFEIPYLNFYSTTGTKKHTEEVFIKKTIV